MKLVAVGEPASAAVAEDVVAGHAAAARVVGGGVPGQGDAGGGPGRASEAGRHAGRRGVARAPCRTCRAACTSRRTGSGRAARSRSGSPPGRACRCGRCGRRGCRWWWRSRWGRRRSSPSGPARPPGDEEGKAAAGRARTGRMPSAGPPLALLPVQRLSKRALISAPSAGVARELPEERAARGPGSSCRSSSRRGWRACRSSTTGRRSRPWPCPPPCPWRGQRVASTL